MIYKLMYPPEVPIPDAVDPEFECDKPRDIERYLELMTAWKRWRPKGWQVDPQEELDADIRNHEIGLARESDVALSGTYRRGRGGNSDLGSTADGGRRGVWKPKTPEDEYS